jgi:hypothetical protein
MRGGAAVTRRRAGATRPRRRRAAASTTAPRRSAGAPRGRRKARSIGFVERHAGLVVGGVFAVALGLALVWTVVGELRARLAPPVSAALMEHLLDGVPHLPVDRLTASLPPIERVPDEVKRAIRRAAHESGVDAGYLAAVAARESRFDPLARAEGSSAVGLFQFTAETWLRAVKLFGPAHGLGAEAGRIGVAEGDVSVPDERTRAKLLKLREDPYVSAVMAAALGRDNAARLERRLGRKVTPAETYIAHFLGIAQAAQIIEAAAATPGASASRLLPVAAAANPGVFRPDGSPAPVGAIVAAIGAYFEREAPRFARL